MGSKSGLPVPATSGDSVALRRVSRRGAGAEAGDGGSDGDRNRSGLQRIPFQFGPRSDDLAFAFLVSFVKNILRNLVSQDVIILSLHAVKDDMKATDKQMGELKQAVLGWWKSNKMWPNDF